jgi:hypothetical protein
VIGRRRTRHRTRKPLSTPACASYVVEAPTWPIVSDDYANSSPNWAFVRERPQPHASLISANTVHPSQLCPAVLHMVSVVELLERSLEEVKQRTKLICAAQPMRPAGIWYFHAPTQVSVTALVGALRLERYPRQIRGSLAKRELGGWTSAYVLLHTNAAIHCCIGRRKQRAVARLVRAALRSLTRMRQM